MDAPDPRRSPGGTPTHLTPLMWACRNAQTAAVAALLAAGASVAARDAFRREPLRHAAARGALEAVRLLLQRGADVHAKLRVCPRANSDMIRWSRVLLSHTLDAARSY